MKLYLFGMILIFLNCAQAKQKYKPEEVDETKRLNSIFPSEFQIGKNYCHDSGGDFIVGFVRAYDEDNDDKKNVWYVKLMTCRLSDSVWKMFNIMIKRPTSPSISDLTKLTYRDNGLISHIKVGDCSFWFNSYGSSKGYKFDEPYSYTPKRIKAYNEISLYLADILEKANFCEK